MLRLPRRRRQSTALLLTAMFAVALLTTNPTSASAPAPATPAAAPGRPNIVVVMADDLRVDDLRFMPKLRRLVGRHGLRFENSFSPYPLCCPARASFLTGQYAHNHKVYWHDPPYGYASFNDSRTLATSLRRSGYRTGFVGKYLNGYGKMRSKVSGRPSYRYVPNGWSDWRGAIENPGRRGIHGGTYNYFDIAFNANGRVDNKYRGEYQTVVLGDVSKAMASRFSRRSRPFFMYVNYVAPHHGVPHEADDPGAVTLSPGKRGRLTTPARPDWVKGRFDRVVRRAPGLPRSGGPSERDVSDKPRQISALREPSRRERRFMKEAARQRAESIFVMDQQVGRLVQQLKRAGEWRRTVFVFTSDNGVFEGEHRMRTGKVLPYEPVLRVPLLITGPGMRSPERRYDPITTIDLTATILELAGAAPPHLADGASRVSSLRRDRGWTRPVLTEATHTDRLGSQVPGFPGPRSLIGIRTPRYSLIKHHTGEHELYDLARDPAQLSNVYGAPAYATARDQLEQVWTAMRDCDGSECQAALPPGLSAGPAELRQLTRRYWSGIKRIYG